jgi:hypothetical protein
MAKLKSTAVKVYPSAFRGLATGMKYNPEARLNTEFNVTNLINRLASKDSFVISWNPTTNVIIFNIHGYYFENNLTEFLSTGAGSTWTNVYARIRLLPFLNDEGEPSAPNTKYKAITLAGTSDVGTIPSPGVILDVTTSSIDTFFGIDLNDSATSSLESTDYELHLLSGGPSAWAVPLTSRLKFVATDVEGLPTINNSTTLKTNNTIFAPITAGTAGQLSVSQGGTLAPTWISTADVVVGEATQAVQLKTSRNLWGRPFNGTAAISGAITGTGNITPTTNNASNIGASDNVYANVFATTFTGNLTGNVTGNVSGNAGTVTNGVVTTSSYTDPSWLTISATKVGLGNVTNESKATMFTSPTFTGTVSGVTKAMVGLGNVDNTSDANKPVSTAQQTALNLKANLASPTFTGTVSGITAAMVGAEPVNANIQSHISSTSNPHGVTVGQIGAEPANANIQAHISSTSNPHSVTATQVGLGNVTNHAQIRKLASSTNGNVPVWGNTSGDILNDGYTVQTTLSSSPSALVRADAIQTALNLKANIANPTFTGTVTLGSSTVGSSQQPIFLSSGTITAGKERRFSYIVSPTGTLNSTTWTATTLSITCTAGKYYKIQGLLFFNRLSGNSTGYALSLTHNQGGGSPTPDSYYFAHYRNASGNSTITPLYTLPFASSVSDANSIVLEAVNGPIALSPLVIDGYFYSGNATAITLYYRMGTSGGGGINIAGFSHLQLTEM